MVASKPVPEDPRARAVWVREQLDVARAEVRREQRQGLSANRAALMMATQAEAAVTALFASATEKQQAHGVQLLLVALGSLGRRELCPYSDLDLVLVSNTPEHAIVRKVADAFFYPLWDARLEVGHAVRSPQDFAQLVKEDETARTGALDWRPLAGSTALAEKLQSTLTRTLGTRRLRGAMLQSIEAWLADDDVTAVYRLQPDIKNGGGGLREAQRVWWAARLLWKIESWQDLLIRGRVEAHDLEALRQSQEALLGIRLALHFAAQRRQEQLRFDLREEVAQQLGIVASSDRSPADELLRLFFANAKALRTSARHMLARCLKAHSPARPERLYHVDGFEVVDNTLTFDRRCELDNDPVEILRIFRVAQSSGKRLHLHARERIVAAAPRLLTTAFAADPRVNRLLLDILADCTDGGHALTLMHELGVLERLIPELAPVAGMAQRELYHVYTVDAHLVACARAAMAIIAGRDRDLPPDFAAVAERVSRPHLLVFAALFHDVGKGYGHGHSERGGRLAAEAANRLGLDPEDKTDLVFLVEEHLSLFRLSQRRDLEDHELIARFAARVENTERLDLLLLLSYADSVATGPGVWTDWKAALIRQLYLRTAEALRGGIASVSLVTRAQARRSELEALLVDEHQPLQQLLQFLTPRHLVSHRTTLLVRHLEAMHRAGVDNVCCTIAFDSDHGTWSIIAVGPDRPGLLADLAGELAATGVSVDAAQISTSTNGLAVDTFVVGKALPAAFGDDERRLALVQRIEAALLGRHDYIKRLQERRRAAAALVANAPLPETRVVFDLGAAASATVVDLFSPDRVGLLHDIARVIFEAGASIELARINTEAGRAEDAFYVVNATSGQPLDTAERALLRPLLIAAGRGGQTSP